MSSCIKKIRGTRGQATVEAALLIPVVFLLLLLLIQPGIILYDRMVMRAAAAEGCRMLATRTDALGSANAACEAFVLRRLGSIPPHDLFHRHAGGCTWEVEMQGGETTSQVSVTIRNTVQLLPVVGSGALLLGVSGSSEGYVIEVTESLPTQPGWVAEGEAGLDPGRWVAQWL